MLSKSLCRLNPITHSIFFFACGKQLTQLHDYLVFAFDSPPYGAITLSSGTNENLKPPDIFFLRIGFIYNFHIEFAKNREKKEEETTAEIENKVDRLMKYLHKVALQTKRIRENECGRNNF